MLQVLAERCGPWAGEALLTDPNAEALAQLQRARVPGVRTSVRRGEPRTLQRIG